MLDVLSLQKGQSASPAESNTTVWPKSFKYGVFLNLTPMVGASGDSVPFFLRGSALAGRLVRFFGVIVFLTGGALHAQYGFSALSGERVPYTQQIYGGAMTTGGYGNPVYPNGGPNAMRIMSVPSNDMSLRGMTDAMKDFIESTYANGEEMSNRQGQRKTARMHALELYEDAAGITEAQTAATIAGLINGERVALNKAMADPSRSDGVDVNSGINHQPLIHVKVRVVEVQRTDSLSVSSILDFITNDRDGAPFGGEPFSAASINAARRRLSGISRLPVGGLVGANGLGAGMLVNLTTENIDFLISMLATEVSADTVTAPQVTTLNGKPVSFRAGSFVPFALGRNTIVNEVNTVNEVFYRHVGAFISVTPQIVNWGPSHEGLGRVRSNYATTPIDRQAVHASEVALEQVQVGIDGIFSSGLAGRLAPGTAGKLRQHSEHPPLKPERWAQVRGDLVSAYNELIAVGYSRAQISEYVGVSLPASAFLGEDDSCGHCEWKPSDCTIDLNLAVRVSDPGLEPASGDAIVPQLASSEQNVRAIENHIQLKSGRGVVLGGLITMRDVDTKQKVPFLGDLPIVGAAFRSTETSRIKTETLIFLEAEVLPSFDGCYDECGQPLVENITRRDFENSRIHTMGAITDTPLNLGMHRAGLAGEYMPIPTHSEQEYWRCYNEQRRKRRHHRLGSHVDDVFK